MWWFENHFCRRKLENNGEFGKMGNKEQFLCEISIVTLERGLNSVLIKDNNFLEIMTFINNIIRQM